MLLSPLVNAYIRKGYSDRLAAAKVAQDIILLKISKSKLNQNITIKGGVILHHISNDIRRSTIDIDIDFIKYSIEDEYIMKFIDSLNEIPDGITVNLVSGIVELRHDDYYGKRIVISLTDKNEYQILTKLDIGVLGNTQLQQEKYNFRIELLNEVAILFANSKEEIIAEKLKSLLKFSFTSTRYKDIFDIYYLINHGVIDIKKLKHYIQMIIIDKKIASIERYQDILNILEKTFKNKTYISRLSNPNNNWLEIPVDQIIESIKDYFKKI